MTPDPDFPGLRVLSKLGAGGFSDVYLCERDHPRIKVAVKVLRLEGLDSVQMRMFRAEADVMAELAEHPFIVGVLGAGTTTDGRPYLVMQYFPPPDLRERVARQPMSVAEALRTGIQLASAVETAHRAGIIHRDIKPANVLVSSYGVPGLTDFGIAGRGEHIDGDDRVGLSLPWAAPEIIAATSNGSAASDVYSLAATVWHLLVGHSPYARRGDNSDQALMQRILNQPPPATGRADVPPSLDRLLQQAMARNPAHRPSSAAELARHLQRVEQELRLARTDLVVLDAPQGAAPQPEVGGSDEETMLKRPQSVSPSGRATDPRTPTRVRGDRVTEDHDDQTALRPAASHEGTRPWLAGVSAAVLLAAAGVVGIVLAGQGEEPDPLPEPPGPSTPADVIDDLVPVATPELAATSSERTIRFTASSMPAGAAYDWSVRQPRGTWERVDQPSTRAWVDVRPRGRGEVCAKVFTRVDGAVSGPHELCEEWPAS